MSEFKKNGLAFTKVILAFALLGTAGVVVLKVSGEVSALGTSLGRVLFAIPTVWLLAVVPQMLGQRSIRPIPRIPFCWSKWQWRTATCRAVNTLCFITALEFCGTATGFLLCNMTPIYVLGWQFVFEKRLPTLPQWLSALVVCGGSIGYFWADPHHLHPLGVAAGILGAATFAGFFWGMGKTATEDHPKYLTGNVLLGDALTIPLAVMAIAFCQVLAPVDTNWANFWSPVRFPALWAIGWVAVLGIFQSGLSGWLVAKGQGAKNKAGQLRVDPIFVAFMPTAVMVWAPFLTWKTMGETFVNPRAAAAFIIVHLGVLFAALYGARKNKLAAKAAAAARAEA